MSNEEKEPLTAESCFKVISLIVETLYQRTDDADVETKFNSAEAMVYALHRATVCSVATLASLAMDWAHQARMSNDDRLELAGKLRALQEEASSEFSSDMREAISKIAAEFEFPDPFDPNARVREEILNGDL